ncbi:hypothetical protein GWI33_009826 [Rhynchophorus ferrugineus]|uniref:Uncharacterized protein n=1 Tax=Rhynchophorus ferrugineus TaxID=354439 RepID=A0A834IDS9_RHYFE|nr:hypothetical protein GWI33_009826 [Rhynchophorus ferrugineus]
MIPSPMTSLTSAQFHFGAKGKNAEGCQKKLTLTNQVDVSLFPFSISVVLPLPAARLSFFLPRPSPRFIPLQHRVAEDDATRNPTIRFIFGRTKGKGRRPARRGEGRAPLQQPARDEP